MSDPTPDIMQEYKRLRTAAEKGDMESQFKLGLFEHEGTGGKKDFDAAAKWFREAADQNHSEAQLYLGHCYIFGTGVPMNFEKAASYFQKSSDQGNTFAKVMLAVCYKHGRGVKPDPQIENSTHARCLFQYVENNGRFATGQSINLSGESPSCPTCGSQMVLRTARQGANAGNQFWGCSNYPKCRGPR